MEDIQAFGENQSYEISSASSFTYGPLNCHSWAYQTHPMIEELQLDRRFKTTPNYCRDETDDQTQRDWLPHPLNPQMTSHHDLTYTQNQISAMQAGLIMDPKDNEMLVPTADMIHCEQNVNVNQPDSKSFAKLNEEIGIQNINPNGIPDLSNNYKAKIDEKSAGHLLGQGQDSPDSNQSPLCEKTSFQQEICRNMTIQDRLRMREQQPSDTSIQSTWAPEDEFQLKRTIEGEKQIPQDTHSQDRESLQNIVCQLQDDCKKKEQLITQLQSSLQRLILAIKTEWQVFTNTEPKSFCNNSDHKKVLSHTWAIMTQSEMLLNIAFETQIQGQAAASIGQMKSLTDRQDYSRNKAEVAQPDDVSQVECRMKLDREFNDALAESDPQQKELKIQRQMDVKQSPLKPIHDFIQPDSVPGPQFSSQEGFPSKLKVANYEHLYSFPPQRLSEKPPKERGKHCKSVLAEMLHKQKNFLSMHQTLLRSLMTIQSILSQCINNAKDKDLTPAFMSMTFNKLNHQNSQNVQEQGNHVKQQTMSIQQLKDENQQVSTKYSIKKLIVSYQQLKAALNNKEQHITLFNQFYYDMEKSIQTLRISQEFYGKMFPQNCTQCPIFAFKKYLCKLQDQAHKQMSTMLRSKSTLQRLATQILNCCSIPQPGFYMEPQERTRPSDGSPWRNDNQVFNRKPIRAGSRESSKGPQGRPYTKKSQTSNVMLDKSPLDVQPSKENRPPAQQILSQKVSVNSNILTNQILKSCSQNQIPYNQFRPHLDNHGISLGKANDMLSSDARKPPSMLHQKQILSGKRPNRQQEEQMQNGAHRSIAMERQSCHHDPSTFIQK